MATIYSPPKSIQVPTVSFSDINKYRKECDEFIEKLRAFVKSRKKGDYIGEIIRFPVADSHAEYMVASLRPAELIHIPLWDAWDFNYAHLLGAKEIKEEVDRAKNIAKIFGGK